MLKKESSPKLSGDLKNLLIQDLDPLSIIDEDPKRSLGVVKKIFKPIQRLGIEFCAQLDLYGDRAKVGIDDQVDLRFVFRAVKIIV